MAGKKSRGQGRAGSGKAGKAVEEEKRGRPGRHYGQTDLSVGSTARPPACPPASPPARQRQPRPSHHKLFIISFLGAGSFIFWRESNKKKKGTKACSGFIV